MNARPSDVIRSTPQIPEQIGSVMVKAGFLTSEQVDQVIFMQRKEKLLFGEAARKLRLITERQVQQALLLQYGRFGVPQKDSGLARSLRAALMPFGKQAESIRDLRSQLTLRWFKEGNKALAVLGVDRGDGCSVIAANLAISYAQLGERTVLIDANLRAPRLHTLFSIENRMGLSSVLTNRVSVKEALVAVDGMPGLMILPAGPTPPNPQELICSVTLDYLVETIPAICDVVIFDTPAMSTCADAQLIAAKVGAGLLSVRRHRTCVNAVARAAAALKDSGVRVLGTALNE